MHCVRIIFETACRSADVLGVICVSDSLMERPEEEARGGMALWALSPGQSATARALATLKALLPLRRRDFEGRLAEALREAAESGSGFFLKGFSARRALGSSLVVDINPLRVEKRLYHRLSSAKHVYLQDRFIGAGSWQSILRPLDASATHCDVQEVVQKQFEYRLTQAYRQAMERSGGPRPIRRNFIALKSPQLVEGYFKEVARLCRSIGESGMRRRADCRSAAAAFRNPKMRLPWVELVEGDIGLAIGADGEGYHFGSGKHRIAAAQALKLTSIPVEVRMVHADWLERQIASSGLPPVEALLGGIRSLPLARQ